MKEIEKKTLMRKKLKNIDQDHLSQKSTQPQILDSLGATRNFYGLLIQFLSALVLLARPATQNTQGSSTPLLEYTFTTEPKSTYPAYPHPSFATLSAAMYVLDGTKFVKITETAQTEKTVVLDSLYITSPLSDLVYLRSGSLPTLEGSSSPIGKSILQRAFSIGDLFGGSSDPSKDSLTIIGASEEKVLRVSLSKNGSEFRKLLKTKTCGYIKNKVVLCAAGSPRNQFIAYLEPEMTDNYYNLTLDFSHKIEVLEVYREDLVIGCGLSTLQTGGKGLICSIGNFTNSQFYEEWEVPVSPQTAPQSPFYANNEDLITIYPDQYLVSVISSNNSIVFYSTRDGSFQFETAHQTPPHGLAYNKFNSRVTYIVGNKAVMARIQGPVVFNIPRCAVSVPEKEICLRCVEGFQPSTNRSACWEEISSNWYSYSWGQGASSYLIVKFKIKEEDDGNETKDDRRRLEEEYLEPGRLLNEPNLGKLTKNGQTRSGSKSGLQTAESFNITIFMKNLSADNVRLAYRGQINPTKYLELEDVSTDLDIKKQTKRFFIKYKRNIELGEIRVRFLHPNFNSLLNSCPYFTLFTTDLIQPRFYVEAERMPAHWANTSEMVRSQYLSGFKMMSVVILALKVMIVVFNPFVKTRKTRKKLFWLIGNLWMLQTVSFIGLLGVNFRGLLGLFLKLASLSVLRVWNLEQRYELNPDVHDIGRDVYMGKFSGWGHFTAVSNSSKALNGALETSAGTPEFNGLIIYQLLPEIVIYAILVIISILTSKKIRGIVTGMRVGFAYSHLLQITIFSILSIRIFLESSYSEHWLTISSFACSLILLPLMLFEAVGVHSHMEHELEQLHKTLFIFGPKIQNMDKSGIRESQISSNSGRTPNTSWGKNLFGYVERSYLGFDVIGLKKSIENKNQSRIINQEEEFFEWSPEEEKLGPVKTHLVKKIAGFELDEKVLRASFGNAAIFVLFPCIVGLFPSSGLIQGLLLVVLFGYGFLANLVRIAYIEAAFGTIKVVLVLSSYLGLFLFALLLFVLALDNISPFIDLQALKALTNVFISLFFSFWIIQLFLILVKIVDAWETSQAIEEQGGEEDLVQLVVPEPKIEIKEKIEEIEEEEEKSKKSVPREASSERNQRRDKLERSVSLSARIKQATRRKLQIGRNRKKSIKMPFGSLTNRERVTPASSVLNSARARTLNRPQSQRSFRRLKIENEEDKKSIRAADIVEAEKRLESMRRKYREELERQEKEMEDLNSERPKNEKIEVKSVSGDSGAFRDLGRSPEPQNFGSSNPPSFRNESMSQLGVVVPRVEMEEDLSLESWVYQDSHREDYWGGRVIEVKRVNRGGREDMSQAGGEEGEDRGVFEQG